MTMPYDYLKDTPRWMIALLVVVGLFAIFPIANLIVIGYQNLKGKNPGSSLAIIQFAVNLAINSVAHDGGIYSAKDVFTSVK